MRPHRQVSAENRLRSHNIWAQNRLSKTKSPKLNTCEAFLFMLDTVTWQHELKHIPQFCLSTLSVNHTILISWQSQNFQKTTRNISTFNTGEITRQITRKNCRILQINRRWKLFSSHTVDLFQILDVNQRLKRRHGAPAFQTIFWRRRLWPGQRSASISISPDKFHP